MTCVITGGTRGIGQATATLVARMGRGVAVVGRQAEEGRHTLSLIEAGGGKAIALQGDMSRPDDIVRVFAEAGRLLGPIDAVVNAAGMSYAGRVDEFDADKLSQMMAVNVVGLMLCCREAARRMSTRHGGSGGSIVNISSMAATIGGRPGASAYAASKAAVDVFTTGFAREVAAEGIRVNTIRPGVIATSMTAHLEQDHELRAKVSASIPMGRIGQPDEIAEVVAWLLSEKASFVTGAHLNAGGGGFIVAGAR